MYTPGTEELIEFLGPRGAMVLKGPSKVTFFNETIEKYNDYKKRNPEWLIDDNDYFWLYGSYYINRQKILGQWNHLGEHISYDPLLKLYIPKRTKRFRILLLHNNELKISYNVEDELDTYQFSGKPGDHFFNSDKVIVGCLLSQIDEN